MPEPQSREGRKNPQVDRRHPRRVGSDQPQRLEIEQGQPTKCVGADPLILDVEGLRVRETRERRRQLREAAPLELHRNDVFGPLIGAKDRVEVVGARVAQRDVPPDRGPAHQSGSDLRSHRSSEAVVPIRVCVARHDRKWGFVCVCVRMIVRVRPVDRG